MTPHALLAQLHAAGVVLWNDAETLRYRAPKGLMTAALVDEMRQHKAVLLALLELYEERAAILEYDSRLPRTDAERQAWAIVLMEPDPKTGPHTTDHAVVVCPQRGSTHVTTAGGGPLGLVTCGACVSPIHAA